MAVNRDMSAIALRNWPTAIRSTLDGLAATGAWGIRMALETRAGGLVLNDRSNAAAELARENVRRNGIEAIVSSEDLAALLSTAHYDFVDIDPFGPPTPFLGAALESARPRSGLGVTATDTAVLAGTYPEACSRRYGARPLRCEQGAEIGVRILLAYTARVAARHGKTIEPLLSFAAAHFIRLIVRVRTSRGATPVGWMERVAPGDFRWATRAAGRIGPLWNEALHNSDFVARLQPTEWTQGGTVRLLSAIQEEADLPPFFVTTDELAAQEHGSPPKIDRFIRGLREIGFRAARTHFHPRGVRTDAPYPDLVQAFRERMPSGSTDGSRPAS